MGGRHGSNLQDRDYVLQLCSLKLGPILWPPLQVLTAIAGIAKARSSARKGGETKHCSKGGRRGKFLALGRFGLSW